ncbi:MAG: zinc/iron permease [uncultured bacterium]|nr:MAG: zinc/iron permease [uncultured bacterium]
MSTLEYILVFTFLGSIASLAGGFALLSKEKLALKISHFLASFAAGTLLGAAFFDLLPEALHEGEESGIDIFLWSLVGILLFFLLERFIHWFHHHEEYPEHKRESKSTVPLIVIGDTMHNFVDGVVIAATFLVSIPLGIVTAIAVAMHEIPQEIGDFGLLLHKGLSRRKVVIVNIASASVAFMGAIITYILGDILEGYIPILLALTAGFFIYIATSDLIPEIHHEKRKGFAVIESVLLIVGVIVIWLSVSLLHHG